MPTLPDLPAGAAAPPSADPCAPAPERRFQLQLHPSGTTLMTGPGETLWQAMQAAAVPWPVSCRNGSCRACMGVLRSGAVRYTVEWPGLLPEEKAQGCVLPCVACASTDVVLASA